MEDNSTIGAGRVDKYIEGFNNLWIFYEKTGEAYGSESFNPVGNLNIRVVSGAATSTLSTMTVAGVVVDKKAFKYFKELATSPFTRTLRKAVLVMMCGDWESFISYVNNYYFNGQPHFHKYLTPEIAEFLLIRNCIIHHESIATNDAYYDCKKIEKRFPGAIKKRFSLNDLIELRHTDIEEFYNSMKRGYKTILLEVEQTKEEATAQSVVDNR